MIRSVVQLIRISVQLGISIQDPSPKGMIATTVTVEGPPGLVIHEAILPATELLRLEGLDLELRVWSGTIDIVVPFHAVGELASEVRPLDVPSALVEVTVRYQACDDHTCLLPKTEKFMLDVPLDVIDIPKIASHVGHGQREAAFDGSPHVRRAAAAQDPRPPPLGFVRFIGKTIGLEVAALWRRLR